ncbi:MAG: 37S ribosomal protein S22 [Geoglossum umbratile]|nr:MAG: 37S ribosomal protein S22 [Geoglossum umbratile]
MLAARPLRSVCLPCRLRLLTLVENGVSGSLQKSIRAQSRAKACRPRNATVRSFTTSQLQRIPNEVPQTEGGSELSRSSEHMEEMVRYVRRAFGDSLPENFLTAEEYKIYERLYGPPLRRIPARYVELSLEREEALSKNALLEKGADGEPEESHHYDQNTTTAESEMPDLGASEGDGAVGVEGQSPREIKALMRLRQDILNAMNAQPVEEEDPEYEPEETEEGEGDEEESGYEDIDEPDVYTSAESIRAHPNTLAGRSSTSPTTLSLPRSTFLAPIESLLANIKPKHHTASAEKIFGGSGLPWSPFSPASKRHLQQKPIALEASQSHMTDQEGDAYLSCVMPGVYAAVMSTLVEVRKRLGSNWLSELLHKEGGPRFLDAGGGGAGIIAWREVLRAEWESIRERPEKGDLESPPKEAPFGKATAITGSEALRHRISRFIENTSFIPRIPDYVHVTEPAAQGGQNSTASRKQYDVIVAPHTLWPLGEDYQRKRQVQNLWSLLNPDGGVLILLEKGLPRGFEAVAGAREMLLSNHISSPDPSEYATKSQPPFGDSNPTPKGTMETGMIVAPCTNHTKCPMYHIPGPSHGRKDFCHFKQRYIRPPLLQRIMHASDRNHEDIKFSYLAVRRGRDERATNGLTQGTAAAEAAFSGHNAKPGDDDYQPMHPLSLPRSILPPLKRQKHVIIDVCTPAGKLERWTVPRSFGRQAYRDASKSSWGDLWPLGAKTRVPKNVRLGGKGEETVRAKRKEKRVFEVEVGEKGMEGVRELVGWKGRGKKIWGNKARKERVPREITEDSF